MMEITRMNQSCPHCRALVILPEPVHNYGDMPIHCHDCENSFFLPTDQLSKTSGGVVRNRCRSCKLAVFAKNEADHCAFALCLPELRIALASPTLAAFTQLARHSSGRLHWAFHCRGRVSIGASLFGDAECGFGDNKDNIDRFLNSIQSWVTSLYTAL